MYDIEFNAPRERSCPRYDGSTMTEHLSQHFEEFARGAMSAADFERALLAICMTTPDSAWNVLAQLDQYHRRRKLSAELYRAVRHRIQRHALGIEKMQGTFETAASTAPPVAAAQVAAAQPAKLRIKNVLASNVLPSAPLLPFRHLLAGPADSTSATSATYLAPERRAWRLRRGRTHALALAAIVCGVAASPAVKEIPARADTAYQAAQPAAAPEPPNPGPELVSLSSDQYLVYPNKKLAEISVQRGEQTTGAASFVWWTEGAGAKPNEDFISAAPRLTQMADGVASVKLLVPILANPSRRHIEMFYVMIGKLGGGARLGPVRRATVFIMPRD
jgi:hypothetical protein